MNRAPIIPNKPAGLWRIQRAFSNAVHQHNHKNIQAQLPANSSIPVNTSINTYKNNTTQVLLSVLKQTFSVCLQIVGEECFTQLALRFINTHPSKSTDLNQYGDAFALYLSSRAEVMQQTPYLADMATLEWRLNHSYYARSRKVFPFQAFQAACEQSSDNIAFLLADDISLIASRYPLYDLWKAHQNRHSEILIHCQPGDYFFVIERKSFQPDIAPIQSEDYFLLQSISAGCTLRALPDNQYFKQEAVEQFMLSGWIKDFYVTAR